MSDNALSRRELYLQHPVRHKAIEDFNKATNYTAKEKTKDFMCEVMSVIGLELEKRFPGIVRFDDKKYILFGREKSEKSTENKKRHNIALYDLQFLSALAKDDISNLPTKVRPIFDYYAFKLICPEIDNPRQILSVVLNDILSDIERNHPESSEQIQEKKSIDSQYYYGAYDYIIKNYPDEYPALIEKVESIFPEIKLTDSIKEFLDETSLNLSTYTYSDYYQKLIKCYDHLISLSYKESKEEYDRLVAEADIVKQEYSQSFENGTSNDIIPEDMQEKFREELQSLLSQVDLKKSNKLDLDLGDLMLWDILLTSDTLKDLGISISNTPYRTQKKRNPNGYVANFYRLDMPNNLIFEIQIQSTYRYIYGESGPAAHNKMPNGEKKRAFIEIPQDGSGYEDWAKLQFNSLPKYFKYLGHGFVQVFSTLENFERHYDNEDPEKVKEYVRFITEHDINLLNDKIMIFYLDEPIPLEIEPEQSQSQNKDIKSDTEISR